MRVAVGEWMNKIKSGFFAVAEVDDPKGHAEYNWFHSSDHIPENLALDGVILGTRCDRVEPAGNIVSTGPTVFGTPTGPAWLHVDDTAGTPG